MNTVKNLIREKMHIEEVMGSYITLIPAGKNYKACCPFHVEKTPSLQVNTEKQMFYCFGCKKGGDVFTFIQEIEHVDFKEALKILSEKSGIPLDYSEQFSKEVAQKKTLITIHEMATRFYQLCLSRDTHARDYIVKRGITPVSIKVWRIGYAPDDFQALVTTLIKKGFSEEDLIASGLVGKSSRGLYDRFRGRIMFPITDHQGNTIAFSGRLLPGTREGARSDVGKYINSPETLIYHKSQALFGFSLAKETIRTKKEVIIVEGQMDAILSHQVGHLETVALSGTAATDHHMEVLARFADRIIIATDGDHAGIASAHKIALSAYRFDREVELLILPDGMDPADMITTHPESWNTLISQQQDYIDFHGMITKNHTLREKIIETEQYLFPVIAEIMNHVRRDGMLQKIAHHLQVSVESIRNEFQKYLSNTKSIGGYQDYDNHIIPSEINSLENTNDRLYQELAGIHQVFPQETMFWFDDHSEIKDIIATNQYPVSQEQLSVIQSTYNHLNPTDQTAWRIRLDTMRYRISLNILDTEIVKTRNQLFQEENSEHIAQAQKQLLELQSKKEALIRQLAE